MDHTAAIVTATALYMPFMPFTGSKASKGTSSSIGYPAGRKKLGVTLNL